MDASIIIAWLIAAVPALPLFVLGVECFIALVPNRAPQMGRPGSVAIVIPAHNEAHGLARTLRLLKSQIRAGDRILVVADNCADQTAAIARESGVEVLERFDDANRGKGFALEAGVRYLEHNSPPDIVVFLDADCEFGAGSLCTLTSCCSFFNKPVQARNLVRLPDNPIPQASVSAFAFLVKNWVRPRALHNIGLPPALTGTGMAFPWTLIVNAPLRSGEIVEDLVLGSHFTARDSWPVYCETAHVWSDQPNVLHVVEQQRTRWEHGYLSAIFKNVPGFFRLAVLRARPWFFFIALDFLVPPLALLTLLTIVSTTFLITIGIWSGDWSSLLVLTFVGSFAATGVGLAWLRFGRELIPGQFLLHVPGYVFRKLNIYARFVTQRQKEWIRTQR
jgi:cellulose synthase/poly-beta-1,6-N-acetylglucosamine synthase-like glycosyltransferase